MGVVWTFLLSSIISLLFLPIFGRRPDIDWNNVSKGQTQNNQPTNYAEVVPTTPMFLSMVAQKDQTIHE